MPNIASAAYLWPHLLMQLLAFGLSKEFLNTSSAKLYRLHGISGDG